MESEITLRHLARAFVRGAPRTPPAKDLVKLGEFMKLTDDLELQPINQMSLSTGEVFVGINLVSIRDGWQITTSPESIDVAHIASKETTSPPFATFLERVADVYSVFTDKGTKFHRLACVTETLLPEVGVPAMNEIAARFLRFPPTFESNAFEWDWRCVATVSRTFAERTEETNTLVSVRRLCGTFADQSKFDRIRLDLDINTPPSNDDLRFDGPATKSFFLSSVQWHSDLHAELKGFLGVA